MTVDQLVTMNDKARKQAFRTGLVSGLLFGAGIMSFATLFTLVYLIEAFYAILG